MPSLQLGFLRVDRYESNTRLKELIAAVLFNPAAHSYYSYSQGLLR